MKRVVLLFVALWALALCSMAQTCRIYAAFVYSEDKVKINYGTEKKYEPLKDEAGRELRFFSFPGALNYLSSQGWRLEGNFTEVSGSSGGFKGNNWGRTSSETTYIISKEVSEEEAKALFEQVVKEVKE